MVISLQTLKQRNHHLPFLVPTLDCSVSLEANCNGIGGSGGVFLLWRKCGGCTGYLDLRLMLCRVRNILVNGLWYLSRCATPKATVCGFWVVSLFSTHKVHDKRPNLCVSRMRVPFLIHPIAFSMGFACRSCDVLIFNLGAGKQSLLMGDLMRLVGNFQGGKESRVRITRTRTSTRAD